MADEGQAATQPARSARAESERTLTEDTAEPKPALPPMTTVDSITPQANVGGGVAAHGIVDNGGAGGDKDAPPAFTDQTNLLPTKQVLIIFLALSISIALSFIDQMMLAVAIPLISQDLGTGEAQSWIASAYVLTSAAFQPMLGAYTNIFGRKVVLLGCIAGFFVTSLMCALAKSMTQLIVFRALQGIPAGGLITVVFIVMSDVVSLKQRGKYSPIMEAVIAVCTGVGPLLGGVFSQSEGQGWRWCFWGVINLPLSAIGMAIIWRFLPLKKVEGSMRRKLAAVDYMGSFLSVAASILVMTPLTLGGVNFPWSSGIIIGLFVGGAALWVILGLWEWKVPRYPILPMPMLKSWSVLSLLFTTMSFGALFAILLFYLPQLFQLVFGYSAVQSALYILPTNFATTIFVIIAGQIQARTGRTKIMMVAGLGLAAIVMGLLSTTKYTTSKAQTIGLSVVVGVAQGMYIQTSLVCIQASVSRADMAQITSVRNYIRMLGTTLGLSLSATLINNGLRTALVANNIGGDVFREILNDPVAIHGRLRGVLTPEQITVVLEGYMAGFNRVFQVAAAWTAAAAVAIALGMREPELSRPGDAEEKAKGKQWMQDRKDKKTGKKERAGSVDAEGSDVEKAPESPVEPDGVPFQKTSQPA